MANHKDDVERWIDEKIRSLNAGDAIQAPADGARARLGERREMARRTARRRAWIAGGVVAGLIVLLALPWPRAAAQRLFDRLTAGHIAVIETSRRDLPDSVTDSLVMKPQPWQEESLENMADAERIAGFHPMLPPSSILPGTPKVVVVRKATLATAPFNVAAVERALRSAGVVDVAVPKNWEGVTLSAEGGPAVVADYGDLEIIQAQAFHLTTPADVPFGRFMELAFRVFGRPAAEARRLGDQMAANPALVMHFPGASAVRDVPLQKGSGVLVGNPDGQDGMCFFWNASGRIYIIEADKLSEARAVSVANSIP